MAAGLGPEDEDGSLVDGVDLIRVEPSWAEYQPLYESSSETPSSGWRNSSWRPAGATIRDRERSTESLSRARRR
jgi:hypothetical protein